MRYLTVGKIRENLKLLKSRPFFTDRMALDAFNKEFTT